MHKQLDTVLAKEVSRKEFLAMSGLAVASVMGFGTVIKFLTGHSLNNQQTTTTVSYGTGSYGGVPKS